VMKTIHQTIVGRTTTIDNEIKILETVAELLSDNDDKKQFIKRISTEASSHNCLWTAINNTIATLCQDSKIPYIPKEKADQYAEKAVQLYKIQIPSILNQPIQENTPATGLARLLGQPPKPNSSNITRNRMQSLDSDISEHDEDDDDHDDSYATISGLGSQTRFNIRTEPTQTVLNPEHEDNNINPFNKHNSQNDNGLDDNNSEKHIQEHFAMSKDYNLVQQKPVKSSQNKHTVTLRQLCELFKIDTNTTIDDAVNQVYTHIQSLDQTEYQDILLFVKEDNTVYVPISSEDDCERRVQITTLTNTDKEPSELYGPLEHYLNGDKEPEALDEILQFCSPSTVKKFFQHKDKIPYYTHFNTLNKEQLFNYNIRRGLRDLNNDGTGTMDSAIQVYYKPTKWSNIMKPIAQNAANAMLGRHKMNHKINQLISAVKQNVFEDKHLLKMSKNWTDDIETAKDFFIDTYERERTQQNAIFDKRIQDEADKLKNDLPEPHPVKVLILNNHFKKMVANLYHEKLLEFLTEKEMQAKKKQMQRKKLSKKISLITSSQTQALSKQRKPATKFQSTVKD
jgi:hypothetical protein